MNYGWLCPSWSDVILPKCRENAVFFPKAACRPMWLHRDTESVKSTNFAFGEKENWCVLETSAEWCHPDTNISNLVKRVIILFFTELIEIRTFFEYFSTLRRLYPEFYFLYSDPSPYDLECHAGWHLIHPGMRPRDCQLNLVLLPLICVRFPTLIFRMWPSMLR